MSKNSTESKENLEALEKKYDNRTSEHWALKDEYDGITLIINNLIEEYNKVITKIDIIKEHTSEIRDEIRPRRDENTEDLIKDFESCIKVENVNLENKRSLIKTYDDLLKKRKDTKAIRRLGRITKNVLAFTFGVFAMFLSGGDPGIGVEVGGQSMGRIGSSSKTTEYKRRLEANKTARDNALTNLEKLEGLLPSLKELGEKGKGLKQQINTLTKQKNTLKQKSDKLTEERQELYAEILYLKSLPTLTPDLNKFTKVDIESLKTKKGKVPRLNLEKVKKQTARVSSRR